MYVVNIQCLIEICMDREAKGTRLPGNRVGTSSGTVSNGLPAGQIWPTACFLRLMS